MIVCPRSILPPVDLEIESLDELTESLLDGLLGSGQEAESYP